MSQKPRPLVVERGQRHCPSMMVHSLITVFLLVISTEMVLAFNLAPAIRRNNFIVRMAEAADLEYDLVIVGAGASGMFASGASTSLGARTLLLDVASDTQPSNVGGDCTNAACVPSKAVRSIGRLALGEAPSRSLLTVARKHATATVEKVRKRENPSDIVARNPNLDLMLVSDCHFTSPHRMSLNLTVGFFSDRAIPNNTGIVTVQSKNFLIATGASPVVPKVLETTAKQANLPLYTYRDLFRPREDEDNPNSIWNILENSKTTTKRIVIVGGGATACEVGQALARLGGSRLEVIMVTPSLLKGDDVTLQDAAAQLLAADYVEIYLNKRVTSVRPDRQIELSDGSLLPPVDALVVCTGRQPELDSLKLEAANVKWDPVQGVLVHPRNLRSTSAPHVYACGDCCSAVASKPLSRTAAHGAWTGYHAASNMKLPWLLRLGRRSTHAAVPRVIYTDPELAMVGLSLAECVERYGMDGFQRLYVSEKGTDRADIDSMERNAIGFVELRARKVDGKILGFTGCGPAAAEIANEMSLAITNGLTVGDIARSLHSYPSHGYLLYRASLPMALGNVWGALQACGPVGGALSKVGISCERLTTAILRVAFRRKKSSLRRWEAEGASKSIVRFDESAEDNRTEGFVDTFQVMSYYDVFSNSTLTAQVLGSVNSGHDQLLCFLNDAKEFSAWLSSKP